jgi:uncharacterized protein YbcI
MGIARWVLTLRLARVLPGGTEERPLLSAIDPPLHGEELLSAVTAAMIALHERYHHRAPVSAKTQMLDDDLLACVMAGVYTDVEKTMIELQRSPAVRQVRSAFQVAMQQRFIDEVERLAEREVITFMSDSHVGPDIEIELFVLKSSD